MKTPNELIQEIIPEAKPSSLRSKWYVDEWIICFGCGFIGNRKTMEKIRFFRDVPEFEAALKKLKERLK